MDFKYRAFLSYSHADTAKAKWLHKRLESCPLRALAGREMTLGQVPKELRPIFRDREDFSVGHSLTQQTLAALDASAALVVLCSPASAESAAVNEEVRLFKANYAHRPLVPLILDGAPGDPALECFPPALRLELNADGSVSDRPTIILAADLRETGDGRELALAKVVAALIGVPSDEVFRRAERERRLQGRLRAAIVVTILLLASAGGYLGWRSYTQEQTLTDIEALGARPLYASGATRQVAYRLDGKQGMASGNRRPCFEGHGPQRGQSPPLSQLQQIVCGADNAPFRLHLFEAP